MILRHFLHSFLNYFFSQSEDDVEKRRQKFRQPKYLERSFDNGKYSTKVSFGTQTDFREIEVQTEPCTISYENDDVIKRRPEVTSLSILKNGRGLPIQSTDDLVRESLSTFS
jgi:hypothetical protein